MSSSVSTGGSERIRVYYGLDPDELEVAAAGAAALLAVRHPHLYPVHAFDDAGGVLAIRGPLLREVPGIPPIRDHVLGLVAQIAQAAGALHARSILHLDIASSLGFIVEDGWSLRAVLLDSEAMRPFDAVGRTRDPLGPPGPDGRRSDVRTDVYGLGLLLADLALSRAAASEPALDDVLAKMIAADPDRRPSTTDDVLDELARLGWQRTTPIEAQPYDRVGHHQLVVVRPALATIALDRRRANVWTLGWSNADCELWKYQDSWFLAPRRDREVRVDGGPVRFPDRVPLRVGQRVATGELAFVLAPLADVPAAPWHADEPDRRGRTDGVPEMPSVWPGAQAAVPVGGRVLLPGPNGRMLSGTVRQLLSGYYEVEVGSTGETLWVPKHAAIADDSPAAASRTFVPASPRPGTLPGVPPIGFGPPPMPRGSARSHGRMLGTWEIVEELGSGAITETFRVRRDGVDGVAKQLLAEACAHPAMQARFEREIAVLRRLRHLAIPRLLDQGTNYNGVRVGGLPFFVMEDVGSETVADRLRHAPLSLPEAVAIGRDVLAALDVAHHADVIHRDLTPSNVVVPRAGGFAKLLDFGIAHLVSGERADITGTGALVGTPAYMSPEQARGSEVTAASDVYAAGCLLYEMLAGTAPYQSATVGELLHAHVHVPPPRLPSAVPADVAAIVTRMLAKDPAERPSCRDARDALAPFLSGPTVKVHADAVEVEPGIWRWPNAQTTMMLDPADAWSIAIHGADRRDNPRLRLHTLLGLAREAPEDSVTVYPPSRDGGWWIFGVSGPPLLPRALDTELAVKVFDRVTDLVDARSKRGAHVHRLRREHVRAILQPPDRFRVVLDVIDDDTLVAADPGSRGCIATQCRLLFELLEATDFAQWPAEVLRLHELYASGAGENELYAELARLPELVDPSPNGTMPQLAGPPGIPFALQSGVVPDAAAPADDVGKRFGNWRVVRMLGQGGMACAYEVVHVIIDKRAVAKTLTPALARDPQVRTRFVDEARAVNAFRHPNVVDIFEFGEDELGVPYIVMEYLSGESLATRIARGALPARDAIEITRQVAAGLAAAHAAGVIHRDLKPGNIVFTDEQRVKLLDFGLARVPRSNYQTPPGTLMGTPAYMSPEQWRGAGNVDPRSDIYSVGATLFEMISGAMVFTGDISDIASQVAEHPAPPLIAPAGALHPRLVDLVARMLAKDPDARPQSCTDLLRELDEIAPPPAASMEAQLARAGFANVVSDGTTAEAIPRYDARDAAGAVKIYVAQPDLRGMRAVARVGALAYLARERVPLFIPIEKEIVLPSRATAYVRRDPVPPALELGERLAVSSALAVAAVAFRALVLLRAAKRRFENFQLSQVRADVSSPEAFSCLLQPPQVFDREAEEMRSHAGQVIDNLVYQSPEQLVGDDPYDVPYAVGILAYELLSGTSPFADLRMFELNHRKMSEDPPRLSDVPRRVADFVAGLIARDRRSRSRPPALIEAELLALLSEHPEWRAAAERVLERAPTLTGVSWEAYAQASRSPAPTLAPGERIRSWTVAAHLRFGGDAEVYLVTDEHAQRAILKLWYADGIDPFSAEWAKFRRGMLDCAKLPGFPAIREIETIARGGPRAFAVFEEIIGKDWRALVDDGRPAATFVLDVAARLLATLDDAHGLFGAVGDVSPTNVIVRDDATPAPILLDVMTPGQQRDRLAGYGTPGYIAPEVTNGETPSIRSDLFSAGVLVAELALGRRLFPAIVEGLTFPVDGFDAPIARALDEVRALYGATFAAVLARMLAIDPKRRVGSAREVSLELREISGRARVRSLSRQMGDSSTLRGLERRLPRPIAQGLRRWRITEDPQWRVRYGFGLAELVTRYLAAVALADYLAGPRDEAVEAALAGLRRPSFGTWRSIAHTTARALGERGGAFVPEVVEMFAGKGPGLAAIDAVIVLRNKYSHTVPVIPDGELPEVFAVVTRHVHALLVAVRFLGSYPLLLSENQAPLRNGRFDGRYTELHGTAGEPEQRHLQTAQAVAANVVLMMSPDLQERLILEPFIVHRECKACSATSHTYVLAEALDKGDVKYFDQLTGHELRERPHDANGAACAFFDLFGGRDDLALRGPLVVAVADGERFWRGDSPVLPGQVLEGVVLEEEIGRGAMGVVYRARDKLDRPCAVKIVRPEVIGEDRTPLHQLQAEARKLSRIDHPHVVDVWQFGFTPDENNCFIVMELLEGGSLEERLRSGEQLSFDDVLGIGAQLLDAVAHVHAAGIVHRDLKPANVLFASPGKVKIVDFGMARDLRAGASRSNGYGGATLHYCSPEQLAGNAIGPWTDVYALGLVLYDLAAGQPAALDPQRRTAALRATRRQLREGAPLQQLAHHAGDSRLPGFLETLAAMTELEPERRPAISGVRFSPAGGGGP